MAGTDVGHQFFPYYSQMGELSHVVLVFKKCAVYCKSLGTIRHFVTWKWWKCVAALSLCGNRVRGGRAVTMSEHNSRDHDPHMHLHNLELPQYVYENLVHHSQHPSEVPLYQLTPDLVSLPASDSMINMESLSRKKKIHTLSQQPSEVPLYQLTPDLVSPTASSSMINLQPLSRKKKIHTLCSRMHPSTTCANTKSISFPETSGQLSKRKRRFYSYSNEDMGSDYDMLTVSGSGSNCDAGSSSNTSMSSHASRIFNKTSSYTGSGYVDEGDKASSTSMMSDKKHTHSQIEKRRRDKMNTYITELSALVPMCRAMARKLDKVTVLRMAVQHLRSVRGTLSAKSEASPSSTLPRPAFISERNVNDLLLQTAEDCFMFVVSCDRGQLLYVSSSVNEVLHFDQRELIGQSVFDIIHPKDVSKVKEQLSSSDLGPRNRIIDAKTMLPIKQEVLLNPSYLCSGTKRSFFCRIKCKLPSFEEESRKEIGVLDDLGTKTQSDKKYCILHCTGYLKYWAPSDMMDGNIDDDCTESGVDEPDDSLPCLVAVGRSIRCQPQNTNTGRNLVQKIDLRFFSRHAIDGKFLFVEQSATLAVGFLPQEMVGTSIYEYVNEVESGALAHSHRTALLTTAPVTTSPYSFKRKDGSMALMQTLLKPFKNPWTKEIECLVATHTVLNSSYGSNFTQSRKPFKIFGSDKSMEAEIGSHVQSHNSGSDIAEEVLSQTSPIPSPDKTTIMSLDTGVYNYQSTLGDTILEDEDSNAQVLHNVPLSSAGAESPAVDRTSVYSGDPEGSLMSLGMDGNGEANMAVAMSLLEADAEFCLPFDLTSMPWEDY